jgi:hypothetical protein
VSERLDLERREADLRRRYTALLSLLHKSITDLTLKDVKLGELEELREFIETLESEKQDGCEVSIVKGWITLRVPNPNHQQQPTSPNPPQLKFLLFLFQS